MTHYFNRCHPTRRPNKIIKIHQVYLMSGAKKQHQHAQEVSRFFYKNVIVPVLIAVALINMIEQTINRQLISNRSIVLGAQAHVVLTRDDQSQSLVLTGEDGKGGNNGDQVVIAGNNINSDGDSKMIMQNAAEREGDIVMNGKSMIIPGEDGHIVLADSRSAQDQVANRRSMFPPNPIMFWLPYLAPRFAHAQMMPFFG